MKVPGKIIAHFLLFITAFFVVRPAYAQLQFIENKGQWDKSISFKGILNTGAIALTPGGGYKMLLQDAKDLEAIHRYFHGESNSSVNNQPTKLQQAVSPGSSNPVLHSHMYEVKFLNGNLHPQVIVERPFDTYNNYFIGNDKSKWATGCKIYQAITYKNIYRNIDVRYYTNNGQLKYDLIVNPGGNATDIAMYFDGADNLKIKDGELHVRTSVDEVKELSPYSYQGMEDGRKQLECKYDVKGNVVRFKVEEYSRKTTLIIDPTLVFSSFSGSRADNWGYTATYDGAGNFYNGGIVFASGFPLTPGAYQQNFKGGNNATGEGQPGVDASGFDMGILKFSSNGSKLLYGTYIGGSGGNEQPHSMIVDNDGNLVITGRTTSSDYPVLSATIGAGGGQDIVVSKLNPTGTQLLGSLRIGGSGDDGVNVRTKDLQPGLDGLRRNYGDDARSEVIVDASNNIYLASCTQSTNFYVSPNAFQQKNAGGAHVQDAVVMKLNSALTAALFSSYLGGSGDDAAFVLDIDPLTNDIYIGGATASADFPGKMGGTIHPGYGGGACDGFITVISNDGSLQKQTTYIGTNAADQLYGIQFDKFGYPYIMGTTEGTFVPVNSPFNNNNNQTQGKQFIAKLKPDLSQYVYLSTFGPNSTYPNISPTAFLVDRCQNVYVAGWGGGLNSFNSAPGLYNSSGQGGYPNSGTTGLSIQAAPDGQAPLKSTTDGRDFYFFVLERNAQSQLYGSFFGQNDNDKTTPDHVDGGTSRFDQNGIIYEAICANCGGNTAFPITPGVYSTTNAAVASGNGYGCNMAAIKIAMNLSGVAASVKAVIDGKPNHTNGCVPLTVAFIDTIAKAKRYIWSFGDGSPVLDLTTDSTTHTYIKVGVFTAMLIAIDSSTCNISDTAYITIKVGNNIISPDFTTAKIGDCKSLTYQFRNTTTAVTPVYTASSFLWDYGDGSPLEIAGYVATTHTFPSAGTYHVSLIAVDSAFCNVPDTVQKTISLSTNVKAQLSTPARGCAPYSATIQNTSISGVSFQWDFGDGTTSTSTNPTVIHLYNNTGTYTIRLIANDPSTCNKTDTTYFTITVVAKPVAGFIFSPNPARQNTATQFTNTSLGATSYSWDFGDGGVSTLSDPSYQFNATDTFHVCLAAINDAGCADTLCKDVPAIVLPLLDVPNAFTPGKFGVNAVIKVVGFGIGKMDWKIYNRWGQLIFESASKNNGWDGTYKGSLQPTDVYTYTLEVEFTNGKKTRKVGDITLLQ